MQVNELVQGLSSLFLEFARPLAVAVRANEVLNVDG